MSDFIKDLYYGEIRPVEGEFDKDGDTHKAFVRMERDKKYLLENTDGELKKKVASYLVNTQDFYTYNEADVYERGFRMCAQMVREVLFGGLDIRKNN